MALLRGISTAGVVLLALGVCWSRTYLATRKRTAQSGRIESSVDRSGFGYEILERSDPAAKEPASTMIFYFYPHATGVYNGRSNSPPLHVHLYDDEEFEVIEGRMGYVFNGKEGIFERGDASPALPAGSFHTFWNADPNTTLVQKLRLVNRSGRHTPNERFFEQWAGNAFDYGNVDKSNPLQLLAILQHNGIELALPYPVRLFIRHVVVPFAHLLGYKGFYPEYVLP